MRRPSSDCMENNFRPYTDLVNCHCHRDNRMIAESALIYHCSHCHWRIQLILGNPPEAWYQYEGNDENSSFPRCLDCSVPMIMAGAVHLPEDGRYFKVIVFSCGPNGRHEERLLNAYPVEITESEYGDFGPSREDLISGIEEDILLHPSLEDNGMTLLKRSNDLQSPEVDLSKLSTIEQQWLLRLIRLYATRGLLHDVQIAETSVAVTVDKDLRAAFAYAKSVAKTSKLQ